MNNDEKDSHQTDRSASPKQRVLTLNIGFVLMTKSCARDLTDRIKAGVTDVAELLHQAHEGRAWLALGYPSWKDYCKAEFEMSKTRSYQLLDFVEIKQQLKESTNVDSPRNESQTRALKAVSAEKRVEVWERANEIAGSGPLKAKHVAQAVDQPEKKEPEISGELRDEVRSTIAAALDGAWEELKAYPEMDWQLFRSGVRGWLQSK